MDVEFLTSILSLYIEIIAYFFMSGIANYINGFPSISKYIPLDLVVLLSQYSMFTY